MNGFKERDQLEAYLYERSYEIEPKHPKKMEIIVSLIALAKF